MSDMTVEDCTDAADFDMSLTPFDRGNTPPSPGPLRPGQNVDSNPDSDHPMPSMRWPYDGEA